MDAPVPRILLIEEDQALAGVLSTQLTLFNHQVEAADYTDDIPACLASFKPDAIIIDVDSSASKAEGAAILAALRHYSEANGAPVMFVAGRINFDTRLAVIRAGGKALFSKPIDVGQMLEQLESLVQHEPEAAFRVLVVDDSVALSTLYSETLQAAGMTVRVVNDPHQVLDCLEDFSAELILTDLHMPGCSGIELAAILRQQSRFVGIPIVFLSSDLDIGKHQVAMEIGADDFLQKPIDPDRLVSAVSTRARRYRELRRYMLHDSLTGLLNHTTIKEMLEREISRAKRANTPLSFAMVDIDHFKKVNDTYGHPTGDQVIRSLSRLLRQRLRRCDVVGRYGGEEFAVVLPDTDLETAARVMDEIRDSFAQLRQMAGRLEFQVTLSCGVAQWQPGILSLSDVADKALYQAKHGGRNRVCMAKAPVDA